MSIVQLIILYNSITRKSVINILRKLRNSFKSAFKLINKLTFLSTNQFSKKFQQISLESHSQVVLFDLIITDTLPFYSLKLIDIAIRFVLISSSYLLLKNCCSLCHHTLVADVDAEYLAFCTICRIDYNSILAAEAFLASLADFETMLETHRTSADDVSDCQLSCTLCRSRRNGIADRTWRFSGLRLPLHYSGSANRRADN